MAGQEIADSWVFSEIEEGRRCFDLSDATGREREIRELTQQVSERINVFVPENAEVYRQLFPNFQKELQEVQVCLTVGCPNPYDAMVMQREEDGIRHEVIVFDMARFLGYGERALGLVSRLTTAGSCSTCALTRVLRTCWPAGKRLPPLILAGGSISIGSRRCKSCGKPLPAPTRRSSRSA